MTSNPFSLPDFFSLSKICKNHQNTRFLVGNNFRLSEIVKNCMFCENYPSRLTIPKPFGRCPNGAKQICTNIVYNQISKWYKFCNLVIHIYFEYRSVRKITKTQMPKNVYLLFWVCSVEQKHIFVHLCFCDFGFAPVERSKKSKYTYANCSRTNFGNLHYAIQKMGLDQIFLPPFPAPEHGS